MIQAADSSIVKSRTLARHWHLVLAAVTIVASMLAVVWMRYRIIETGYQLSQVVKDDQKAEEENRRLKVELSWQKSPERLEKRAEEKLGLHFPGTSQVFLLQEKP